MLQFLILHNPAFKFPLSLLGRWPSSNKRAPKVAVLTVPCFWVPVNWCLVGKIVDACDQSPSYNVMVEVGVDKV